MKDKRCSMCKCVKTFWSNFETEPNWLKRVVTGDESWIFEYESLTKRPSLEWKSALSPRPKKAKVFKSNSKVMLIAFFDVQGIVHAEFLPQGQTINQHVYKNILRRLMRSVREKKENCGKQGHGCFIMTIFQLIMPWVFGNFLQKIALLYWSNHPTLQIWPLETSFCVPNSRKSSKELLFKIKKPLKQSR